MAELQPGTLMVVPAHETANVVRLTVEDFRSLDASGAFAPGKRFELINGEIVEMPPPIGPEHTSIVARMHSQMVVAVGRQAIMLGQSALVLNAFWQPRPDLALLRPREDWYRDALPTSEDVLLVVEVADSTLRYDHDTKVPGYAEAGIPEAWLIDLQHRAFTRHRDPSSSGYRKVDRLTDSLCEVKIPVEGTESLDLGYLFD